jgi:hypothetical protein
VNVVKEVSGPSFPKIPEVPEYDEMSLGPYGSHFLRKINCNPAVSYKSNTVDGILQAPSRTPTFIIESTGAKNRILSTQQQLRSLLFRDVTQRVLVVVYLLPTYDE